MHFRLGGIDLGTVNGRAQITPHDLAGSFNDYKHDRVIRTARLLQSLDSNGVLADGIQVSDAIRAAKPCAAWIGRLVAADLSALVRHVFALTNGQRAVVDAAAA